MICGKKLKMIVSIEMKVNYWIVQHIPDLMRHEPRNIGIFAEIENNIYCKFQGENEDGSIDGRKIKWIEYPEVYKQWIEFWKDEAKNNNIEEILEETTDYYNVSKSGFLTDLPEGITSINVLNYLFSNLVSTDSFIETNELDRKSNSHSRNVNFEDEIIDIFEKEKILDNYPNLLLHHPVEKFKDIKVNNITHTITLVQENGIVSLIEPIDFVSHSNKKRSIDHAGLLAYKFKDIKGSNTSADAFSLVKITDEEMEISEVRYGIELLKKESEIINWLDDDIRNDFLKKRKEIAFAK